MMKIGITGGIGSGKSTVCQLFASRGVAVYDSDRAARRLMEEDATVRASVARSFGDAVYIDGSLDRAALAAVVFRDAERLAELESIVHPAVLADFERWCADRNDDYVLFESAILFEAHLEHRFDRTLAVLAPTELRIERVCRRDGSDADAVRRRIAAQMSDDEIARRADVTLVNIIEDELPEAVGQLDKRFRHEARHA